MNEGQVVFDDSPVRPGVLALRPGENLRTGQEHLEDTFGGLSSLEKDLLVLASSVFACDLAFKRGERENISRRIKLTVPVVNHASLESIRKEVVYALYVLGHDTWDIQFTHLGGQPEESKTWDQTNVAKVLLFSGGLDSFAAAADLGHSGSNAYLVSHLTGNQNISRSQTALFEHLNAAFPNQFTRIGVRVGGVNRTDLGYSFPSDQAREETQRTRSFLFLTLAGIVARRIGTSDVIMIAENGQLAIHLPLTTARITAFSTHTAHPVFIESMTKILRAALSFQVRINNPFLYMTKGEVVGTIHHDGAVMIPTTISCWASARITGGFTHCGQCVPCMIRRIANESNGIKIDEYGRNLFAENVAGLGEDDVGRRNFIELAEFVRFFRAASSQAAILSSYPDLVSDAFDTGRAIDMYQRFSREAVQVFSAYSNLASIVS